MELIDPRWAVGGDVGDGWASQDGLHPDALALLEIIARCPYDMMPGRTEAVRAGLSALRDDTTLPRRHRLKLEDHLTAWRDVRGPDAWNQAISALLAALARAEQRRTTQALR